MKMADPQIWQPELKARYESLMPLASRLPANIQTPSASPDLGVKFDIERMANALSDVLLEKPRRNKPSQFHDNADNNAQPTEKSLPDEAESVTVPEESRPTVNTTALAVALCGWSGMDVSGVELVQCDKCFQRCGLWLYAQSETSGNNTTASDIMAFDPIELHRSYCPWKSATTQAASGSFKGMAGWQIEAALVEYVAERTERKERDRIIDLEDAAGELPEKSWEEIFETERRLTEKERELESRMAKIKRALSFKKPISKLQKRMSLA